MTRILSEIQNGDERAAAQLLPLVYQELRKLAAGYLARERAGHTLQTTALVNETFLRLTEARRVQWQDRGHFVGLCARLMRRVLVDHARRRGFQKRGGGAQRVVLDDNLVATPDPACDLVTLDRALEALSTADPR